MSEHRRTTAELRTLAQTLGGENVVITVDAGEDPFIRVWRYDRRLDCLAGPVLFGAVLARLGAYVEEVDLDPEAERRLIERVEELLRASEAETHPPNAGRGDDGERVLRHRHVEVELHPGRQAVVQPQQPHSATLEGEVRRGAAE